MSPKKFAIVVPNIVWSADSPNRLAALPKRYRLTVEAEDTEDAYSAALEQIIDESDCSVVSCDIDIAEASQVK